MEISIRRKKRLNTPLVLQMEGTECGAAALGIIAGYYELYLPLEKLRLECGVSRDGSTAVNIVKAARRLGFDAQGYRYSPEKLRDKKEILPVIIHWNFNHFVVVEGFEKDKVYLNDPGAGHRTVSWSEFETSYTGVTLGIKPGVNFQKNGSPPSVLKIIQKQLRGNQTPLLFILLTGLGLIVTGLAIPVFTQVFFDDILGRGYTGWMFNLLLAMGITAVLLGALTYLRSWCLAKWQSKLAVGESGRFFWHVLHLPVEFFQQRYGGEIVSRVQFNESVAQTLTGTVATAVLDMLVAIFYLILLLQYNVTLTVIGVFFSLINIGILYMVIRLLKEQQMKIQQEAGKAYGVSIAGIQTIETLKANGNEGDFFAKWAGYQSKLIDSMEKSEKTTQSFMILPAMIGTLNTAVIMMVGGFQIMDGLMTAGIFFAFQNLMTKFQEPLDKLLALTQSVQTLQTQIYRLDDVLCYPKDKSLLDTGTDTQETAPMGNSKLYGHVEIKNISFGYSSLSEPLIENFSITINPGEKVALVGGSGSGKSTVAKIVTGLYQPWSGEILFDCIPRHKIPRAVIANSLAAVDQETFLFEGTITENISLFDSTIKRQEIVRAAKDAAMHDEISLHGGYDSMIEEGGRNFSGGQRQRLELARAFAGNPSILVLDEATSALDPLTEQQIINNIRHRSCTCLIIAHRLSTIRDCDEIIVMKDGKIAQRGTHEEMIAVDGPYRQLVSYDDSQGGLQ